MEPISTQLSELRHIARQSIDALGDITTITLLMVQSIQLISNDFLFHPYNGASLNPYQKKL